LTSTSTASESTLNVVSSVAGFTGNVIRASSTSTGSGNLLLLQSGGGVAFNVSHMSHLSTL
jgi:hypothetical protein